MKIIKILNLLAIVDAYALSGWNSAVTEILPSYSGKKDSSYVAAITLPGPKAGEDLIVMDALDKDDYILNDHCNGIVDAQGNNFKSGVFSVKRLTEKLTRVDQDMAIDRWHWMLFYEMEYSIKCDNNITYSGIFK